MYNDEGEKEEYRDYTIKYYLDDDPMNPREYGDMLSKFICFHRKYNLGNDTDAKEDDFDDWEDVYNYLKNELHAVIICDLWLYDHSGLALKIGDFYNVLSPEYAYFDSGQVGFAFVTREDIKKAFNVQRITSKVKEKARKVLEAEIETFAAYVSGDVYAYHTISPEGKIIDSCCGFYNIDEMLEQAKGEIDFRIESESKMYLRDNICEAIDCALDYVSMCSYCKDCWFEPL